MMVANDTGGEVVVALVVGWLLTLDGGVACIINIGGHIIQLVAAIPGAGHGCSHVVDADGGGVTLSLFKWWWWWWSCGSGSHHRCPSGGDGGGSGSIVKCNNIAGGKC